MKKVLLYTLLLYSTVVSADPDQFKINITNDGTANCILKNKKILYGYVSDRSTVHTTIRPNETATFLMRSGTATPLGNGLMLISDDSFKDKTILLTYSCGPDQEITLLTDQGIFDLSLKVGGKVLDAQLINAKYTTRLPKWFANNLNDFPEIHWTLTY